MVDGLKGKRCADWLQRQSARTNRPPVHDDQKHDTPLRIKNFISAEGSRQHEQLEGRGNGFFNESSKLIKSDLGTGSLFFLMRQVKTKFAVLSKGAASNCKFLVGVIVGS